MIVRRATLAEILPLRHAELRPGRPVATAHFDGDDEPTTAHVGAFDDGGILACATLMRRPLDGEDAAQLRGMATRADVARCGIGTAVIAFAEGLVTREWRLALLWCNARTSAQGFYERRGWRVVSPVFDVPDVGPHVRMVRRP